MQQHQKSHIVLETVALETDDIHSHGNEDVFAPAVQPHARGPKFATAGPT